MKRNELRVGQEVEGTYGAVGVVVSTAPVTKAKGSMVRGTGISEARGGNGVLVAKRYGTAGYDARWTPEVWQLGKMETVEDARARRQKHAEQRKALEDAKVRTKIENERKHVEIHDILEAAGVEGIVQNGRVTLTLEALNKLLETE